MSDRAGPSVLSRRAVWTAGAGFWLFVSALSVGQTIWIAKTPGSHIDFWGLIAWQTSYFISWIPFTIGVWQFTRGWLPDRFGGWPRLLLAHLPLAIIVVLAQTAVAVYVTRALGAAMVDARNGMPESYMMQLRSR